MDLQTGSDYLRRACFNYIQLKIEDSANCFRRVGMLVESGRLREGHNV